jgi:hypothetical protein
LPPGANGDLEGTWITNCVPEAAKWFGKFKLVITNGVATSTYVQYKSDSSCTDDSKIAVEWGVVTKDWTVGDRATKPTTLDRTMETDTIKITDSELKGIWDQQSGCGPHALGVAEDVRGKTCWNQYAPAAGGRVYDVIEIFDENNFSLGVHRPGQTGQTPETRPQVDPRYVFTKEGAESGFIEASIDGELVRANQRPATPSVGDDGIEISAATPAMPPWKTWVLSMPRAVGQYTCKTAPWPSFINYGFTQDNLPVLWDTEQSGGNDCSITVTKAATGRGDTIEGTFSGVVGDGKGNGHNVTNGSFKVRLTQ